MKIVIPGGTGQIGTLLARALYRRHQVVVLSRRPGAAPWPVVRWDPTAPGGGTAEIDGADVVINLAGRSVNCRYTRRHRAEILQSRLSSVRAVGEAIRDARRPPAVWLQASSATLYAHRFDGDNDEHEGRLGGSEPDAPPAWRFSVEVVTAWERALDQAPAPSTRKVKLRSAMVMSGDHGGIFDTLRRLARRGLGGAAGDGRQFVSWIHEVDFVRAVLWLIERPLAGPVNVAAPHPLPNREFMAVLRRACGAPFALPSSRWMLELGALVLRTETELILKSRRVVPARLLADGFTFVHADWQSAVQALCPRGGSG